MITLPAGKVCPLLAGVPQGSLALAESSRTSERKVMLESRERGCILPEPGFGAEPVCIHRYAGTAQRVSRSAELMMVSRLPSFLSTVLRHPLVVFFNGAIDRRILFRLWPMVSHFLRCPGGMPITF